jgi:diguanylate cyclase (GGDEF)-like protein
MADNVSFALESFSNERQRKAAEAVLKESEERFRSLTHLSTDFFWELDKDFFVKSYEGHVVGESNISIIEALKGNHFWDFEELVCVSTTWQELKSLLNNHKLFRDVEICFTNSEHVLYHFSISGEPIYNTEGVFTGYRGITRDITERQRNSLRIQYLADHDALTDLPNRGKFNKLLNTNTRLALSNPNRSFALFFIDVDRFKKVNDTYGHHTGDALLKDIANRLKNPKRESDIVARLGGDEFVIIVDRVNDRDTISGIADTVISAFADEIRINGHACDVSVSIGISIFKVDAHDEETLLRHADAAMYLAKEHGRNNYQFFQ